MRSALLGLGVGLALADSSVVTLALPDILFELDVGITTVAWVLTSFNLVLALAAVPAAYVSRRSPARSFALGAVVFTGASFACGIASSFEVLVSARCVQALGAALVLTAALDLLTQTTGSDARAARFWTAAGVFGAALGPAAGGVLTQALGWEWIFFLQVPLGLLLLVALRGLVARPIPTPAGRPHVTANAALLALSGGLVAALFLLVLLLVDGWAMSPAAAGLVVTVMPLVAIATARLSPTSVAIETRTSVGIVLAAGGLAALGLLPRAGWEWTLGPQVLLGVGIGLALAALTERAVAGRAEQVVHGGWTLASRHAGVVVGLLLLAPLLTSALDRNEERALNAGAAVVLDSRIPALDKLGVAQDILVEVERAREEGELPRLEIAFGERPDDEEYRDLRTGLQDQLDRAVTDSFSLPFLLAAGLALVALVPVWIGRGEPL